MKPEVTMGEKVASSVGVTKPRDGPPSRKWPQCLHPLRRRVLGRAVDFLRGVHQLHVRKGRLYLARRSVHRTQTSGTTRIGASSEERREFSNVAMLPPRIQQ